MASSLMARGQIAPQQSPKGMPGSAWPAGPSSDVDDAKRDLESCRVHEVRGLPGSDEFASHFLEAIAVDPKDRGTLWGLTADLSTRVPSQERLIYLSKSTNGGARWTEVVRLDSRYFNASIAEGLRNGLSVSPGGTDFVITTQEGALQVIPQRDVSAPILKRIPGPRIPSGNPALSLPKKQGDPVRAGVLLMTADGEHLIIGYGYFDLNPQLLTYHRGKDGSWIQDGALTDLPTDLDIFSMEFDDPKRTHPRSLYVGFGDQAYRLNLGNRKWNRIAGVGPDSAIHGMTTAGGLHLAACWGVYNPVNANSVRRVTHASFLLHRAQDEVGPNIRAYGIEVDPARPKREVLAAITGVYTSANGGKTWRRLNDLPEGEYHTAHFNADGTVIVSGFAGTFLTNPFSSNCAPHLTTRSR
jgi:hypothetical protein